MRRVIALIVRIFFRRIAVTGAEHVPATGPLLLVVNHPNSLVDPLLVLAYAPRRVAFLAKEPLFRTPVIRWLVRAAGSIPVYRRQDGADTTQNRRTFERVWDALSKGRAIALFPEGMSHSDPHLRPFKTGMARMALGAAAQNPAAVVSIVPGGLYYTAKVRFRSSALLSFGEPIQVDVVPVDETGEPSAEPVRALTARLEAALAAVTLHTEADDALRLVTRAERVFSSVEGSGTRDRDLEQQFALRQRFLRGYGELRRTEPREVERVERLLNRYDAELTAAGLAPESLLRSQLTPGMVIGGGAQAIATLLILAPFAVAGMVIHFPGYLVTGPLATRAIHGQRDVIATAKILAAGAIYPISWLLAAWAVARMTSLPWGLAALVGSPALGYAALLFLEQLDRLTGSARGLSLRLFRPMTYRRFEAQRQRIREAILQLNEKLDGPERRENGKER
ncbi:MAG: lysophospholipid acyltransferase family protein, partial [Gemmatimonadales bacterium]